MSYRESTLSYQNVERNDVGRGCIRRILTSTLILFTLPLLLVAHTLHASPASTDLQGQYPPPGRLVSLGDHRLHLFCIGEGRPTIIVEAGSGSWSLQWRTVQNSVATFTRICTYDRAGYGWSDPGPEPRTGHQIVSELSTLLNNAGESGPYVLVGHSLGGLYTRLYASEFPNEVVGMVLVDALHEEAPQRMPLAVTQVEKAKLGLYTPATLFAETGMLRQTMLTMGEVPSDLPSKLHSVYQAYAYQPSLFRAVQSEGDSFGRLARHVNAAGSFDDLPLTVIRHGQPTMFSYLPSEDEQRSEGIWKDLQMDLTRLSSKSRLIVAENSGHNVHLEQPGAVTDAIRDLVHTYRQPAR